MSSREEERPTVRVVHHLARSGGTLISRCLAGMRGVSLLSEIHPRGAEVALQFDPLFQAQYWLKLLSAAEVETVRNTPGTPFGAVIGVLAERAASRAETLVVRDWSHLDFIARPFLERPSGRSQLAAEVGAICALRQVSTVRHPAAQWLSWQRYQPDSGVDLASFLAGCRRFADHALATGFVRFEDFAGEPGPVLARLCELLDIEFDSDYAYRWFFYRNVTGDVASFSTYEIRPAPEPVVDASLAAELAASEDYRATLTLLGYDAELASAASPALAGSAARP